MSFENHTGRREVPEAPWIAGTVLVLALITFVDGAPVAYRYSFSQWVSNGCVFAWWTLLFFHVGPRLRASMFIGLVMATLGEMFFCLAVGMYEYRLGNVPFYVPPGHTVLYVTIHLFCRQPWIRRHVKSVTALLAVAGSAYSVLWLVRFGDAFGFGCFSLFVLLAIAVPRSRLFFGSMYCLVGFLEVSGTHWGCWRWQPTWLGHWTTIPSANPPSGVALFYVLFDLSCLAMYFFLRWRSYERWVSRRVARSASRPSLPEQTQAPTL